MQSYSYLLNLFCFYHAANTICDLLEFKLLDHHKVVQHCKEEGKLYMGFPFFSLRSKIEFNPPESLLETGIEGRIQMKAKLSRFGRFVNTFENFTLFSFYLTIMRYFVSVSDIKSN